jgi:hypothetical protein
MGLQDRKVNPDSQDLKVRTEIEDFLARKVSEVYRVFRVPLENLEFQDPKEN